ncbi:MAG: glutamate 5-kinase, partial [Pseudomonadota bacterium]
MTSSRQEWSRAKRIVIKIGSALLVDKESGRLKSTWLNSLADDISELHNAGKDVVVVSSGSIALGRKIIGLPPGPLE